MKINNRRTVLLVVILFLLYVWSNFFNQALCQTRAKTETGKDIFLYPDGTWKYITESTSAIIKYNKPTSAKKLFKTKLGDFGIWYDDSKWKMEQEADENQRITFVLKNTSGYAMVLAEEIESQTNNLKDIAFAYAKEVDPNAKIVLEEKRTVNGREILCLKTEAVVQQIPVTYYGYYYGGSEGTIQAITYTGRNVFNKHEQDFTNFLNGLVVLEKKQDFSETPYSGIKIISADFGIFKINEKSEPTFIPTNTVPLVENQSYGWFIKLDTSKTKVKWKEEFTLPKPPKTWGEIEEKGIGALSKNRKTLTTEKEVEPVNGLIGNAWAVATGDPSGEHIIRVYVEGNLASTFRFKIE